MQTIAIDPKFIKHMKSASLRVTKTRIAIYEVLKNREEPLSIQSIVQEVPGAHFVSVYRSVDAMQKSGLLRLVPRGFKNLFELSDLFKPHHHHATCDSCGSAVEIHDDKIEKLMIDLAKSAGLQPTTHHFEIHGICKPCQQT